MNIKEIVADSLRYPFRDWKKFFIIGILAVIGTISVNYYLTSFLSKDVMIRFLVIINFIVIILINGYFLRMVKSSINNNFKPPEFNNWKNMFIDGVKFFLIEIVYFIPVILIITAFLALYPSNIAITIKFIEYNPESVKNLLFDLLWGLKIGIAGLATFYMIVIFPIVNIAVAHVANNNSKLNTAFKFREIINKITSIGWKNLIKWYIVIGILYFGIYNILSFISGFLALLVRHTFGVNIYLIVMILSVIIITPYIFMFFSRAVALLYTSDENNED